MKTAKVVAATICGFLIFFTVLSVALFLMAMIIGWIANIPVIGKALLWLGTGGSASSKISVAWYLYFLPMMLTSSLMVLAMEKICGTDDGAFNISRKIVGITIMVVYIVFTIINLIGCFTGDARFTDVIINALYVIFGLIVASNG